ncbi:hypothetical protein FRC03_000700 [Tulasnella sp. 419]|nr:hypothetical protein FRC03_000700 [Tulasnella sp. 419]
MATRTLNFYSYGLTEDVTIMLMFDPPNPERLFIDQWPIAWKVITLRKGSHCKASVSYCARIAFSTAQVNKDNIVDCETWQEVSLGQTTTLAVGKNFTPSMAGGNGRLMGLKNRTGDRATVGIGFVKGDLIHQRYEPTLLWTGGINNSNVNVQFTPKLSAYVTKAYQSSELLRGEVETDSIWTQDLAVLEEVSGWNIIEDGTGNFMIEQSTTV